MQKMEVESALSKAHSQLEQLSQTYRRPSTQSLHNQTVTSNMTMETVDIEDLRQQIAAASFELEEQKLSFRKQMAKREKEVESNLEYLE